MIRSAYVAGARVAADVADRTGLDRWLATRSAPFLQHARSLLAIYDVERMLRLDLPWWTYKAVREVEQFLACRQGARVFEFGSGASTAWLARRAGEVHSVDHDLAFVDLLRPALEAFDNVKLRHVAATQRRVDSRAGSQRRGCEDLDFGDYVAAIDDVDGSFDLIVIDGRARTACLESAVPRLNEAGLIVFDNAARRRYRAAIEACWLAESLERGWAPSLPYREVTAILRRPAAG